MSDNALDALLLTLARSRVRFVVIGGIAVGVHGYVRGTKDVDVCPEPSAENLRELAALLRDLDARHVELAGDFSADEMPFDPLDPADLAEGGNFRLHTRLGALDLMQWIPGIDGDHAYPALAADAITVELRGTVLSVCSLAHLRRMKETAKRPQDLVDLENLPPAQPDGHASR
jgi:hypothetical protein